MDSNLAAYASAQGAAWYPGAQPAAALALSAIAAQQQQAYAQQLGAPGYPSGYSYAAADPASGYAAEDAYSTGGLYSGEAYGYDYNGYNETDGTWYQGRLPWRALDALVAWGHTMTGLALGGGAVLIVL